MANFHFKQVLEADSIIFRLRSHRNFCLEFNKESKHYFLNFFGIYISLVKNQLEKKGILKKYF